MNIKITIKNALTQVKEIESTITVVDEVIVDNMHRIFCESFPDSFVNFKMDDGSWIAGQPYNMAADERRVAAGQMAWEDYSQKWYPMPDKK
jgi:hypothetical protein